MKLKPVRVCDISRILRISSASLISFLQERGYSLKGDFRSPLSGKMVELIQNGYQDGPPFTELNPMIPKAEAWEKENAEIVSLLHKPPPQAKPQIEEIPVTSHRRGRPRKPRLRTPPVPTTYTFTGRIALTFMDLELIQRALALDADNKIKVRDFLRRRTILKALAKLE